MHTLYYYSSIHILVHHNCTGFFLSDDAVPADGPPAPRGQPVGEEQDDHAEPGHLLRAGPDAAE